jgi:hypothetical protein
MPQTRPDVISDGVSLSDKDRREVRAFVSEEGAVDAFLGRHGIVDEVSPDENSVTAGCSKDDGFTGADEL